MASDPLLLDTCAVIWLFNGAPLNDASRQAIANAVGEDALFVSPFAAWEISMLVRKRKIALSMPPELWFRKVVEHPGVRLAELSFEVLMASNALPDEPPGDPADRIVISTARQIGCTIVTRDKPILAYAGQGHVAALAC